MGLVYNKKFLTACVRKGYLFHVSDQKLPVLEPRQADCQRYFTGNLKAVYATPNFFWAIDLVLAKRRFNETAAGDHVHVHVCKPCAFTPVLGNQFVSLFPVVPTNIISIACPPFSKGLARVIRRAVARNAPDNFFQQVLEAYWDYIDPEARGNEMHGPAHAISTASTAYLLARKECPKRVPEVLVGAFFHDIGRVDDATSREHGQRGAAILNKVMKKQWPSLERARVLAAVKDHSCGYLAEDKVSACIWDADRLMMSRLRARVFPRLLSTRTAKQVAVLFNKVLDDQLRRHSLVSKKTGND